MDPGFTKDRYYRTDYDTDSPVWCYLIDNYDHIEDVNIDDYFFGVSAISAGGYESPAVFPGRAGTFEREPPPAR